MEFDLVQFLVHQLKHWSISKSEKISKFFIFKEAKDREISLLRRQNQRLKNKIFELETAQSVTVNKRTQKRGKRYNTRKK